MRKICFILLSLCLHGVSSAQNGVFFGHYMFNASYLNPSSIGVDDIGFVAFQHRSQWAGYTTSFDGAGGAPNSQMLTLSIPVRNLPISSIGINLVNDNLGPQSNFQVQTPINYTKSLRRGSLNVGIAPAIFSQTQNFNVLRPNEPDPLIPGGKEVQTKFNLSAGITYSSANNWYVGLGVINLLEPGFDFGRDISNNQELSYSLIGGYHLSVRETVRLSPTVLIRTNGINTTFDLGGIITLNEKMWFGLSYRKSESAIIYLGYSLLEDNKLQAGYSFDFVFQNQDAKAPTSHEIFLRYNLPDLVIGGKKKVMTPRFSF